MLEQFTAWLVLPILSLCVLLAFVRLFIGPKLPDRVLALDYMSNIGIGFIAAYAVYTDNSVLLDIALTIALLSFLSCVAFGYFLEKFR